MVLLLLALVTFALVIGSGAWAMVRWETRLAPPSDSVLSQWSTLLAARTEAATTTES